MTLDLKNLKVAQAADRAIRLELEHPGTNEPLLDDAGNPYYIEHLGEDAAAVRAIDRKHADRRADKMRKGGANPLHQDVLEREAVERLSVATVSWYLPPMDGESLECNQTNMRRVYSDPDLAWIPEQVAKSMKDRAGFLQRASNS